MNTILKFISAIAMIAVRTSVNSTCGLIVYEPEMPKEAEKYISE